MERDDLRLLAERCRNLANLADGPTRKRLLDLMLRYEAMLGKPIDVPKIVSVSVNVSLQPVSVQSLKVEVSGQR